MLLISLPYLYPCSVAWQVQEWSLREPISSLFAWTDLILEHGDSVSHRDHSARVVHIRTNATWNKMAVSTKDCFANLLWPLLFVYSLCQLASTSGAVSAWRTARCASHRSHVYFYFYCAGQYHFPRNITGTGLTATNYRDSLVISTKFADEVSRLWSTFPKPSKWPSSSANRS